MARIRTTNEIILSLLDFYRTAQPELDVKPGTVARDIFVDGPSTQIGRLYEEMARVSALQSLRQALGIDLDRLGANFGVQRRKGTKASGTVLFTFSEIVGDIEIPAGGQVTAKNGATFVVTNGVIVSATFANSYRAIATQNRADLDFANITDEFAVNVNVEATSTGTQGNLSKYSITNTSIGDVSNVTNVLSFGGGQNSENDTTFRNRILSIFSGANTGTELGYRNAVLEDPAAIDAYVVEPGDVLMTRDGTVVFTAEDGTKTIISEGTGGKVDIYVYGQRLRQIIDSYIYIDMSNTGNPANVANDFVLGQIAGDDGKTVTTRRLQNVQAGTLPSQPVSNITQVTGSLSGANFVEKTVDEFGRITGNYELIKDDGEYGGSPWGFDRLRWISDRISNFQEVNTKGTFNGQDALTFSDTTILNNAQQNISITNENSKVDEVNNSIIQLSHFPVTEVTRVFNATTGERYVVQNQNPDGDGVINNTGTIVISGNSLPSRSDILQVDYTWVFSYDRFWDFDNKETSNNSREVVDSIDWGYSNLVRRENAVLMPTGNTLTVNTVHPISAVINVNEVKNESSTVTLTEGRLSVVVSETVFATVSIIRNSDGADLWNTSDSDGSFSNQTIFLPSDTSAVFGDDVTVTFNPVDVYNLDGYEGSFESNIITIVPSPAASAGDQVEVNYVADISTLLPDTLLSDLPAIRNENNFDTVSQTLIGNQPMSFVFDSMDNVDKNLRQAPSVLEMTISGSVSSGVITASGTTLEGVFDVVYTVGTPGLKQDLLPAIRSFLDLNSATGISSNIKIAKLGTMEKVETNSSLEVLSVLNDYDIKGYELQDNRFVRDESIVNSSLSNTEVELPATQANLANIPDVGDRIRVSFHYSVDEDSENVSFSRSGTLYTNKVFAIVDSVAISSGFTSGVSQNATLRILNQNQPKNSTSYSTFYDYLAPKSNERITVRYNNNNLINTATLSVENTRPINADVLVKDTTPIFVDVIMAIVVTNEFTNSTNIVQQNVRDAVTASLNATELGTIVDQSDVINTAASVDGVDRVRIIFFNTADQGGGSVLSIEAQDNQYLAAGTVEVEIETR